jgi:DNA (cytosine-5)-methyltransferase 1
MRTFLEFFAGGGMARIGLGDGWSYLFANDFDPMKAASYTQNFGRSHFLRRDIADVTLTDLPCAPRT